MEMQQTHEELFLSIALKLSELQKLLH